MMGQPRYIDNINTELRGFADKCNAFIKSSRKIEVNFGDFFKSMSIMGEWLVTLGNLQYKIKHTMEEYELKFKRDIAKITGKPLQPKESKINLFPPPGLTKIQSHSYMTVLTKKDKNTERKIATPTTVVRTTTAPVTKIDYLKNLPNTYLYQVGEVGQYCLNINGVLFRGNMGEIFNNYRSNDLTHVVHCKDREHCTRVKRGDCTYYHDPLDVNYKLCKPLNYMPKAWEYTSIDVSPKKRHTRRIISNAKTIDEDIKYMIQTTGEQYIRNRLDRRKSQLIHDLLVVLKMNEKIEEKFGKDPRLLRFL